MIWIYEAIISTLPNVDLILNIHTDFHWSEVLINMWFSLVSHLLTEASNVQMNTQTLQQQLAIYQKAAQRAKEEGNGSRARRMGRIIKVR